MFANKLLNWSKSKVLLITMGIIVVGTLTTGAWTQHNSLTLKGSLSGVTWYQILYTYYDNFDHVDVDIDKTHGYVGYVSGSGSKTFTMEHSIKNENGESFYTNAWQGSLSSGYTQLEIWNPSGSWDANLGGNYIVNTKLSTKYTANRLFHNTIFAQYWNGSENELVVCRDDTADPGITVIQENSNCPF